MPRTRNQPLPLPPLRKVLKICPDSESEMANIWESGDTPRQQTIEPTIRKRSKPRTRDQPLPSLPIPPPPRKVIKIPSESESELSDISPGPGGMNDDEMGSESNKESEEGGSNYDKNDADGGFVSDGQWGGGNDDENSGGGENSGDNNNRFERSPSLSPCDQEILKIKKQLKRNATLTAVTQANVDFIAEIDKLGHERSYNKWMNEGKIPKQEWACYLKLKHRSWAKTRRRLAKRKRDMQSKLAKITAGS
jgi:hypothetical protein